MDLIVGPELGFELGHLPSVHLLGVDLVFRLLKSLRAGGGGEGPTDEIGRSDDGPPPQTSFSSLHSPFGELGSLLILSRDLLIPSFHLIHLCRDINNVICSASDILSLAMLWIDTIERSWDLENYRDYSSAFSIDQSNSTSLPLQTSSLLSPTHFTP